MTQPSQALLQELEQHDTSHDRRKQIGEALAKMGDPRSGVGTKDGIPDILWLPVEAKGSVTVKRIWHPESPGEEARVLSTHDFDVEPFYIAKYLVTHAQYQAFIEADDGFDNMAWWSGMPEAYQGQTLAEQRTKQLNNPRDSVSWYQSVAFARWLNHRLDGFELPHLSGDGVMRVGDNAQIRLPTEWEWQWAAQNGDESQPYPWGNEIDEGYTNTRESGLGQAIAVGMYPHGAAVCGALDMTGNLMEWCVNNKQNPEIVEVESTALKVLRGGDWGYPIDIATTYYVDDEDPGRIDVLNGFRLVLGQVPTSLFD
ncbi:MAG: formylglycine-generating enzyme family protein [Anaerolineae bacterium]|nr:formylglycine-generating enzyme family protein [Anaerolineae bacterium]